MRGVCICFLFFVVFHTIWCLTHVIENIWVGLKLARHYFCFLLFGLFGRKDYHLTFPPKVDRIQHSIRKQYSCLQKTYDFLNRKEHWTQSTWLLCYLDPKFINVVQLFIGIALPLFLISLFHGSVNMWLEPFLFWCMSMTEQRCYSKCN